MIVYIPKEDTTGSLKALYAMLCINLPVLSTIKPYHCILADTAKCNRHLLYIITNVRNYEILGTTTIVYPYTFKTTKSHYHTRITNCPSILLEEYGITLNALSSTYTTYPAINQYYEQLARSQQLPYVTVIAVSKSLPILKETTVWTYANLHKED